MLLLVLHLLYYGLCCGVTFIFVLFLTSLRYFFIVSVVLLLFLIRLFFIRLTILVPILLLVLLDLFALIFFIPLVFFLFFTASCLGVCLIVLFCLFLGIHRLPLVAAFYSFRIIRVLITTVPDILVDIFFF
jgi:hypothetical protein